MSYSKKMAESALATALAFTFLLLENFLPYGKLSLLAISGLLAPIIYLRCAGWWPVGVYICTSILGMLLLPEKSGILLYIVFIGWFPICKLWVEIKFSKRTVLILKALIFISLILICLFLPAASALSIIKTDYPQVVLAVLLLLACILYDFVIKIVIQYYIRNLSGRLK